MAKKKQFVTAAAAFAVAASAVAPAITADAASTTVRLSSDYVRGGDLNAALDKEYKGSEIHWYKSSIDMNKLGVFQTAKGFVKGKGIKVEKKLRVLNYAQEIKPESEFVFEQGVPVSGIRVQPVLFADGVVYNKPLFVAGFSTEKVGEFEGTLTYSNKAYGSVTKTVKYKVVATKVELSEVKSEVMDDVLSVTADVKNLKDGEKVELVVYANRDMNAALPAVEAEVKDGKLSVKSAKLPAGNHSFILRSGEVKTEAMNFVVEAPMVKEVKAINAKEIVIKFNKAIDKDGIIEATGANAGTLVDNKLVINSLDNSAVTANSATATLSADKMELTIKATGAEKFSGRYDIKLAKGDVKTAAGQDIAAYSETIKVEDTVAPSIVGTEQLTASTVKVKFSEPIADLGAVTFKTASGATVSGTGNGVTGAASFVAGSKEVVFTLGSDVAANSVVTATFVGAKDYAGLLLSPNPTSVSLTKGAADGTKPTVSEITPVSPVKFAIKFSELVSDLAAADFTITAQTGSATVSGIEQDETDKTKYYVTLSGPIQGLTTIALANQAVTDMTGEKSEAVSRIVTFAQDTVAPKVDSAVVVRGTDNKEYLEVTFSEEVTKKSGLVNLAVSGSKTADFVTSTLTGYDVAATNLVPVSGSKTKFRIELAKLLTGVDTENASYNLTITGKNGDTPALNIALVNDVVNLDSSSAFQAQFTRSKDGTVASNNKATIDTSVGTNGIVAVNNNTVTVAFNGELDGASAINVNNYKIDGAIVEKVVLNPATGTSPNVKQTVTLTLKEGSNSYNGTRYVTVSGVKAKNGLAMDEHKTTESFKENVRPVITSAKLTGLNKVVVTFSEELDTDTADSDDFVLLIGGQVVSANDVVSTPAVVAGAKTLELTLKANVTDANVQSGLALKVVNTADLKDLAGNIVSEGQVTITK